MWDYVSLAASVIPNRLHGPIVRLLTGRPEEDTFPTYFRANTVTQLSRLAHHAGFETVQMIRLREHPHYLQINAGLYLIGIAFEQFVQKHLIALRPWILGVLRRPL